MKNYKTYLALFFLTLASCTNHPSIEAVNHMDIEKFMGKWFVIANIPTFIEKGAHNAVESYTLEADGTIATTFTFNQDSFNGELKTYNPTGFVSKDNDAIWEMQFIWPFKSEYRIIYLDKDYTQTVIGRSARDYIWLMARQPQISNDDYQKLIKLAAAKGYDTSKIIKVSHQVSIQ